MRSAGVVVHIVVAAVLLLLGVFLMSTPLAQDDPNLCYEHWNNCGHELTTDWCWSAGWLGAREGKSNFDQVRHLVVNDFGWEDIPHPEPCHIFPQVEVEERVIVWSSPTGAHGVIVDEVPAVQEERSYRSACEEYIHPDHIEDCQVYHPTSIHPPSLGINWFDTDWAWVDKW